MDRLFARRRNAVPHAPTRGRRSGYRRRHAQPAHRLRARALATRPFKFTLTGVLKLRRDIGFGLGVVDIKKTEVESADQIARAIERAEGILGGSRIRYVHPDCGFWMLKRNMADGKIRALVEGRDLYEGSFRAPGKASRRGTAAAARAPARASAR